MTNRRQFLRATAAMGMIVLPEAPALAATPPAIPPRLPDDRAFWLSIFDRLARPVLANLAAGTLRKNMPVESSGRGRAAYTHLEAFGRLMCGISPWLAAAATGDPAEQKLHAEFLQLTNAALDHATNPASPDYLNFSKGGQALVDTAFLAQALLRGKAALWDAQPQATRTQFVAALKASRAIPAPDNSNWVLFASTVESALLELGQPTLRPRLEDELRRMLSWYKGDGIYGDGPPVHADYYNSYVIHPMLLDCLSTLARHDPRFAPASAEVLRRARRYAEILERQIAPDGTYPAIGRSITYRAGAFHALAAIALAGEFPKAAPAAQVRSALSAVLHRTLDAPGTFDAGGWPQIGLYGHQPALGETYISTGSLYLCAAALLPLGLRPEDPFWKGAAAPWTSQRLLSGENLPADHALPDAPLPTLPNLT